MLGVPAGALAAVVALSTGSEALSVAVVLAVPALASRLILGRGGPGRRRLVLAAIGSLAAAAVLASALGSFSS
jgi:hypothetical protein